MKYFARITSGLLSRRGISVTLRHRRTYVAICLALLFGAVSADAQQPCVSQLKSSDVVANVAGISAIGDYP